MTVLNVAGDRVTLGEDIADPPPRPDVRRLLSVRDQYLLESAALDDRPKPNLEVTRPDRPAAFVFIPDALAGPEDPTVIDAPRPRFADRFEDYRFGDEDG